MGHNWQLFLWVRGSNFTKFGKDIGRSSQHCNFVSEFGYLAACGSKLSDALNEAKFRTFCPPPCENKGRVGEISIPTVEAIPTTESPENI